MPSPLGGEGQGEGCVLHPLSRLHNGRNRVYALHGLTGRNRFGKRLREEHDPACAGIAIGLHLIG